MKIRSAFGYADVRMRRQLRAFQVLQLAKKYPLSPPTRERVRNIARGMTSRGDTRFLILALREMRECKANTTPDKPSFLPPALSSSLPRISSNTSGQ